MGLILYIILGTIFGAFAYRIGGCSKAEAYTHFPWFPQGLVKSWFRDLNCTLICLGFYLLFLPRVEWWWYVLSAGSMYGAITTYWDDTLPPQGIDKFWAHGLFIALSTLFVAIPAGLWVGGLLRVFVLSVFMGVWCAVFDNVFVEEYGRGGAIVLSLLLCLA